MHFVFKMMNFGRRDLLPHHALRSGVCRGLRLVDGAATSHLRALDDIVSDTGKPFPDLSSACMFYWSANNPHCV